MREWLKQGGNAQKSQSKAMRAFGRYIGVEVVIFYEDFKATPRKMIGTILGIDEDIIHLKSDKTGWRASVDTSVCRVQSVCTTQGWGKLETNNGI